MAAVSALPSPISLSSVMASRRAPLANNPNAANSPFRTTAAVAGKRSRAQAHDPKEIVFGQPPAKRQIIDLDHDENAPPRTFTRQSLTQQEAEAKIFMKRTQNAQPTAFERKLVAARDNRRPTQVPTHDPRMHHRNGDSLETIRQWQKHYRKAFPQFVFYFESIPDDIRSRISRQIQYLGAKEEKFFSRSVTHVVTTRSIPPEPSNASPENGISHASKHEPDHAAVRTINPALLDQPQAASLSGAQRKTVDLLEATLQGRSRSAVVPTHNVEPRRPVGQSADVLTKARELGIKIWALEKLQRMMTTMFETETGEQAAHNHGSRSHAAAAIAQSRNGKETDLQQLLRNEKAIGPADRDMAVPPQDMCQLRGYFIYVHDMDEKTRPVMVRDYTKVTHKEEGKWPQFRLTPIGRCPFVEDPSHTRKLRATEEQKIAEEKEKARQLATGAPRTRSRSAALEAHDQDGASQNRVLTECQGNVRRSPRKQDPVNGMAKPLDPPKALPSNKRQNSIDTGSMPALFGSAQANMRVPSRFIGGEPVASGVQPSNITSAIRSQIVSSTAISSTAPGMRVGTSKEIHALKRKVLERGASVASNGTIHSSYLNDMRAAINGDRAPPPRAAKRKAQETLGHIHEDPDEDGEEEPPKKRVQSIRKKVVVERELKPGYCENCRDKFDDFETHCQSRKHRKFALARENWQQLDELLGQLIRPLKAVA